MLARNDASRIAAIGSRLQPSLASPCAYHTTSTPLERQPRDSPATRRRMPLHAPSTCKAVPSFTATRAASTAATGSAASTKESSPARRPQLDWDGFFKLRKTRRRLQVGTSVFTSVGGMFGGAQALAMSDMDAIVGQVPLDPFITLGLLTFGCGGVGWLMGPILGTGIFNTMNRKLIPEMALKEKEFYNRIKKFRVDPSVSSMANPVPDYYGEKISSVGDYRQWLKDQRAFNKKRKTFVA